MVELVHAAGWTFGGGSGTDAKGKGESFGVLGIVGVMGDKGTAAASTVTAMFVVAVRGREKEAKDGECGVVGVNLGVEKGEGDAGGDTGIIMVVDCCCTPLAVVIAIPCDVA